VRRDAREALSEDTVEFVRQLTKFSPSLTASLDEHIEDNFGDILPYIFLYDVVVHVIGLVLEKTAENVTSARSELNSILGIIELYFEAENPEIEDLIHVSFLENLPMSHGCSTLGARSK